MLVDLNETPCDEGSIEELEQYVDKEERDDDCSGKGFGVGAGTVVLTNELEGFLELLCYVSNCCMIVLFWNSYQLL